MALQRQYPLPLELLVKSLLNKRCRCLPSLIQALASFTNQGLKGLSQNHQVELLAKYQAVTKEDVLEALKTQFLPLFDPSSSIVVAVTSPAKADEIDQGLKEAGFEVDRRTLEVDPSELEEGSDSEDDESSGSESSR